MNFNDTMAFLRELAEMETPEELDARRDHDAELGEHEETLAWVIGKARAITGITESRVAWEAAANAEEPAE